MVVVLFAQLEPFQYWPEGQDVGGTFVGLVTLQAWVELSQYWPDGQDVVIPGI